MPYVKVTLLQSANSILTTFSGSLQKRALANFKATGVNVRLAVRVTKVTRDTIELTADGQQESLDYGICVWSTGERGAARLYGGAGDEGFGVLGAVKDLGVSL
jgi:NADH:ubiquinone reductase (non-electrogenic)